ncbi:ficolin-1-like [Mauremys reevesii]|uniref:ficolin-1-like n=1 Tax=Mauremys reevesii TaxID=260615 RepID=UPI00193ECA18|nr:ficolin-1-like [Mauremys reevesii]
MLMECIEYLLIFMSLTGANELRIDLRDFENNHVFAKYKSFKILHETEKYKLILGDFINSTAGRWLPHSPVIIPEGAHANSAKISDPDNPEIQPTPRRFRSDSLAAHRNMFFTTKDRDNDPSSINCATLYKGAWWYSSCHDSNLNGRYWLGAHNSSGDGINWHASRGSKYSFKLSEMKFRPVQQW